MNQLYAVNCWRVERTEDVYVGTFQCYADEAIARHGKTYRNEEKSFAYRWEVAYPSLLGLEL